MKLDLIPIAETLAENAEFAQHPDLAENLSMTVMFFARVGYSPPWIGYYAQLNGVFVGACAFKGRPINGIVEIAYGTFPLFQKKGIGTQICRELVALAIRSDPGVQITARTLPLENYSTKILRKNNFTNSGVVIDADDGEVWEWVYLHEQD